MTVWAAVLLVAGGWLTGCQPPLFMDNAPRSPYERYGAQRGRYQGGAQEPGFGITEPELRARLRPLERP